MGQKPDPSYDPESRDQRCYYSREERMSLPNAPRPEKRSKKRIFIMIILDVLLLFFAWQCILDMRRDADRKRNVAEILRGMYHYKAVYEKIPSGYEIKLMIRATNDTAFFIPTNARARMTLLKGERTNSTIIFSDGVSLPRPLHIFRAGFPGWQGGGKVVIQFNGAQQIPDVIMEFGK